MEYKSLYGLPSLAGLCSHEDAARSNWSVDTSVKRLKRLHFVFRRLSEAFVARITSEPVYELKTLFSHHAYLCAEQVQRLRRRITEMREPPLGLEDVPHAGWQLLLDEIEASPDAWIFMRAVHGWLLPELSSACQTLIDEAHPLADAPTVRAAKLIRFELRDVIDVGQEAVDCLKSSWSEPQYCTWEAMLQNCFTIAGGFDDALAQNETTAEGSPEELPSPILSGEGVVPDTVPRRDERFTDPYNAGVNAEAFLYDERFTPRDKSLMMYFKRLREIDVPEMMASILVDLRNEEPWDFHFAMLRQLWDEARHAMMGEVGFVSQGIDWTKIPVNFTWSLNLNSQLSARERHGVLFFIEQGLMPKSGKRYEWEIGQASGDPLSALFQDFDWADEVLHAQIGRRWYVPKFSSLKEALDYGDKCWSKVMSCWDSHRELGHTQHRNWWPEFYAQVCKQWNVEPDQNALAFSASYEDSRADLKKLD